MKKVLIFIIVIGLSFTFISTNSVSAMNLQKENEFLAKQNEQIYKLGKFNEMLEKERNDYRFQASYGGLYFEDTTLYVNVVEQSEIDFISEFDPGINYEIKYVSYTIKELEDGRDLILNNIELLGLREISINDVDNKIIIVTELSQSEFIKRLDNNVNINMIDIMSDIPVLDYNINYTTNGHEYDIRSFQCTVGFAAKDSNGNPGFVTAGHCVENSGSTFGTDVDYDGSHAGDVDDWRFEDGNVDGAFIELRDPWFGTTWLPTRNLIFGGSYNGIGGLTANYAIGVYVTFHGTFGAGGTTNTSPELGQITGTGITVLSGITVLYTDMFKTDIATHDGDSGGPVTSSVYIGAGMYVKNVMGVLSFEYLSESYFSKASHILNELDLSAY